MGKNTILVIRADDAFSASLRSSGLDVTNLPLIGTKPLEDQSSLSSVLSRIDEYDGIFFTSPAAAEVFVSKASPTAAASRVYAMGGRSREMLKAAGYAVVDQPKANTAAEFVSSFEENEFLGKKLLFVRGERSLLTIPTLLADKAKVEEVVVYQTVENELDPAFTDRINERLQAGEFDWTCFFSPSAVESFCKKFDKSKVKNVAAIGSTTAATAAEHGLRADFISPRSSAHEFSKAFVTHINGN